MSNAEIATIMISIISLVGSAVIGWLTLFRFGTVRMTQPTSIYFGPDGKKGEGRPKVYVRALLFASAHRGCIIESMFAKLRREESTQTFNIWVYGQDGKLDRGSGVFIDRQGNTCYHHFLLPND